MKILTRSKTPYEREVLTAELDHIGGSAYLSPPVCHKTCHKAQSRECHHNCPDIPKFLSCDRDYPIEPKIAPLAYALKRLGVFEPFWSCEGHYSNTDFDSSKFKLPRLWFYTTSVIHLRVLNEAIQLLFSKGHLNTQWDIFMTHTDDHNPDSAFSLQPHIEHGNAKIQLSKIHDDIQTIALNLEKAVTVKTQNLRDAMKLN